MQLHAYLSEKRETASDFAARVGMTRSGISRLAAGERKPSLATAIKIATATAGKVTLESWRDVVKRKRMTDAERFAASWRLEPTTGCHVWVRGLWSAGYAAFSAQGKRVYGHRYIYEKTKGAIPPSFHIDHLCRRAACVNPAHLEAVTAKENFRRSEHPAARKMRR